MRHSDGSSSKKSFFSFVKEKEEDSDKMQEEAGKNGAKRRQNDQRVSNVRVHEDGTLDGPNNRGVYAGYEA